MRIREFSPLNFYEKFVFFKRKEPVAERKYPLYNRLITISSSDLLAIHTGLKNCVYQTNWDLLFTIQL